VVQFCSAPLVHFPLIHHHEERIRTSLVPAAKPA